MIARELLGTLDAPPATALALLAEYAHAPTGLRGPATVLGRDPGAVRDLARAASIEGATSGAPTLPTPEGALATLGVGRAAIILFGRWLTRVTPPALRYFDEGAVASWQHATASAIAAHELAPTLGLDATLSATAALLHDIGKLAMAPAMLEASRRVNRWWEEGVGERQVEVRLVGADHGVVGAELLARWGLPELVVGAVRHHHAPQGASAAERPLAELVQVASAVARLAGLGSDRAGLRRAIDIPTLRAAGLDVARLGHAAVAATEWAASHEWLAPRPTRRSLQIQAVSAV